MDYANAVKNSYIDSAFEVIQSQAQLELGRKLNGQEKSCLMTKYGFLKNRIESEQNVSYLEKNQVLFEKGWKTWSDGLICK